MTAGSFVDEGEGVGPIVGLGITYGLLHGLQRLVGSPSFSAVSTHVLSEAVCGALRVRRVTRAQSGATCQNSLNANLFTSEMLVLGSLARTGIESCRTTVQLRRCHEWQPVLYRLSDRNLAMIAEWVRGFVAAATSAGSHASTTSQALLHCGVPAIGRGSRWESGARVGVSQQRARSAAAGATQATGPRCHHMRGSFEPRGPCTPG
jgi:hypothetical protein